VPAGELIFANVLDARQRAAEGEMAEGLVYVLAVPARGFPFAVVRDWKAPTGYVPEEVQLIAPSGKVSHRIGPRTRWMVGSMDLTRIEDTVEDAVFGELGVHLASFLLDGEVLGQTQFQVVLQAAPQKLTPQVEEGLKKSDIAWIGVEYQGKDVVIPAWFVYRGGKILVLSSIEPSLEEQTVPGLPDTKEVLVITRRKYRDTSLGRFHAAVRLLDGPEWDQAAGLLADRRRDRHGPSADAIKRWRGSCVIAELTPVVSA
jgi:hypothetical protein